MEMRHDSDTQVSWMCVHRLSGISSLVSLPDCNESEICEGTRQTD